MRAVFAGNFDPAIEAEILRLLPGDDVQLVGVHVRQGDSELMKHTLGSFNLTSRDGVRVRHDDRASRKDSAQTAAKLAKKLSAQRTRVCVAVVADTASLP